MSFPLDTISGGYGRSSLFISIQHTYLHCSVSSLFPPRPCSRTVHIDAPGVAGRIRQRPSLVFGVSSRVIMHAPTLLHPGMAFLKWRYIGGLSSTPPSLSPGGLAASTVPGRQAGLHRMSLSWTRVSRRHMPALEKLRRTAASRGTLPR